MAVFGFIGLGVLVLLHTLAAGARRFQVGPQWLRQFIIDKRTFY